MEALNIAATKSSPSIRFFPEENVMEISGYSYPQNASQFYKPVLNWLEKNLPLIDRKMILKFQLIFLNTSSSKFILTIIQLLEKRAHQGLEMDIRWYYQRENETACDCGEFFRNAVRLPIQIIEIQD